MNTAIQFFLPQQADEAVAQAKTQQRPLLIDFWATNCKGCEKMEAVTYEDAAVQAYLDEHFVAMKCHVSAIDHGFSRRFVTHAILWTPSLFVFAPDGALLRTIVGYLPPKQFIAELTMSQALLLLRGRRFGEAATLLANVPAVESYPALHQEVLYWSGVAAFYEDGKNLQSLVPHWQLLREGYPGSAWTQRADVFADGVYAD